MLKVIKLLAFLYYYLFIAFLFFCLLAKIHQIGLAINIEEQARKIYEKSYKNSEYERVKKDFVPENIMIIKKEYEKKLSDEILEFTLNLILKYNIKETMILDLSNELKSIIEQYEGNWTQYVKTNHIYILKLKKAIETNIVNKKNIK